MIPREATPIPICMSEALLVLVPVLDTPGGLSHLATPSEGDGLYAIQRQRTRILDRTAKGIDVDGVPFAPYSTNRAYWYYPNGRVGRGRFTIAQNKSSTDRLFRKISRGVRGSAPFQKTRDGQGIRFDSYADFKASLGRYGVDLRGPRAPHMLQELAVGTGIARNVGDDQAFGLNDRPQPATDIALGIYGEAADRANGHNNGIPGKLPQRRFLGANAQDLELMTEDIAGRIKARITAALTK